MPTEKEPWFVVERSEAVAGLLLSSRKDVRVRSEDRKDDGVDLLVEVNPGEPLSTRFFVVQVKGTASPDTKKWLAGVIPFVQPSKAPVFVPVCIFVVNVRDNQSLYAWAAEPSIDQDGATLKLVPAADFHELNESAVNDIVNRVKAWYDVQPARFSSKA